MSHSNGSPSSVPPLFTIEQTELIRRLRKTGVTKEQLVFAFDSFDRLDLELGADGLSSPQHLNQNGGSNPLSPASSNGPLNYSQNSLQNSLQTSLQNSLNTLQSFQNGSLLSSVAFSQANVLNLPSCSFASQQRKMMQLGLVPSGTKRPYASLDDTGLDNGYDSLLGESMLNDSLNRATPGKPHKMMLEAETEELAIELNEFAMKGENFIFDEIREFVHTHGVKQHQLAAFCGLSQSYVSRYLRGDYHDIAEKSKRAIHRWYLVVKKNPAALVMTLNTTFVRRPSLNTMTPLMSQIPMGLEHDFLSSQRRERFVFKQAHIEILEKHFKADNYPSFAKREEIARECNAMAESTRADGRPLTDREIVNVQVVTNWYANKRKELKKIAKEEGLDNIIAQMRSRGRPCASRVDANPNPFSGIENLTSTHQNINNNSSLNGNSIHNHLLMQQMQHLQGQANGDEHEASFMGSQANGDEHEARFMGGQANGDEHEARFMGGQANGDEHEARFMGEDEDQSDDQLSSEQLSMAVEVAAVNSAILQLHGNQLASIKQELAQSSQSP